MSATNKTWVNNSPPQCEDDDLNGFALENNNLIEGSGQSLNISDRQQTHKAVSNYSCDGDFYSESGIADAYILSPLSGKQGITTFRDGQRLRFRTANTNTGASTVNPNGLGVKTIVDPDGNALSAGKISATSDNEIVYDLSNDRFILNQVQINNITGIEIGTPTTNSGATLRVLADHDTNGTYTPVDWTPPGSGSGSGGTFGGWQIFTSSGTYTKPAGLVRVKVTVVGGGGGGGGYDAVQEEQGGAGSGGGAAIKIVEESSIGATEVVTIGAGGAGTFDDSSSGDPGGTSSFGSIVSATGGAGGWYPSAAGNRVFGGIGVNGDINIRGGSGDHYSNGRVGGGSIFSGVTDNGTAPVPNPPTYGGGGAGASGTFDTNNGAPGIVIIEEFF